jgi:hypothetical protein
MSYSASSPARLNQLATKYMRSTLASKRRGLPLPVPWNSEAVSSLLALPKVPVCPYALEKPLCGWSCRGHQIRLLLMRFVPSSAYNVCACIGVELFSVSLIFSEKIQRLFFVKTFTNLYFRFITAQSILPGESLVVIPLTASWSKNSIAPVDSR